MVIVVILSNLASYFIINTFSVSLGAQVLFSHKCALLLLKEDKASFIPLLGKLSGTGPLSYCKIM